MYISKLSFSKIDDIVSMVMHFAGNRLYRYIVMIFIIPMYNLIIQMLHLAFLSLLL